VSKKVFTVLVLSKGQRSRELVPGKSNIVAGSSYDCDIISEVAWLPSKGFVILKPSGRDHILRLPDTIKDATVTVDGRSLSIAALDDLGVLKKKRGVFLIKLPSGKDCSATIDGMTLEMGMRTVADIPADVIVAAVPVDAALKRSWISRDDYSFLAVLVASALLHFAIVTILDKIEIKKPPPAEIIKQMAPRFARLILESPVKKKVMAVRGGGPTTIEEKKAEPAKEKKTKKVTKEKAVKKVAIKKPVRRSVRKRGLVGVIMAKSRPVVAIDTADDIIQDIDRTKLKQSSRLRGREAVTSVAKSVGQTRLAVVDKDIKGSGSMGKNIGALVGEQRESGTAGRSNFGTDDGTGRGVKSEQARDLSALRSRDEADVYKRVRSYIGGLKYIYNSALRKNQSLKGNVTVSFVITPEGKVKDVALVATTLASEEVVDRILRRIYHWKFNKLRSAEDFPITYTFDFSPVG